MTSIPYVDQVLRALDEGHPIASMFAEDLHWGVWDRRRGRKVSVADYKHAAQILTYRFAEVGMIGAGRSSRVLDLGCGAGGLCAAAVTSRPDAVVVGVDNDIRQLSRCGVSAGVGLVCSDGLYLPVRSGSFTHVLALESLFHIGERYILFREVKRVLVDGGVFVVADFVPPDSLHWLNAPNWFGKRNSLFGSTYLVRSLREYREAGVAAGFELESVQDWTAETLPTYAALSHLGRGMLTCRQRGALRLLGAASAIGLLRYRVLTFRSTG